MRLPRALLCLLQAWLVVAQPPQLTINQVHSFSAANLPNPPTFSLPILSLSFISPGPNDLGQPNVYEIPPERHGSLDWHYDFSHCARRIWCTQQTSFELAVSNNTPSNGLIHEQLLTLPLLGDTTSNQAFLFSPPFSPPQGDFPTYPNYTLPPANLSVPAAPSSPPDFSIFVAPSTSSALASLPRTGCAMAAAQNGSQYVPSSGSQGLWLRDSDGWRWQWMLNFLSPLTNYTAYAVQNGTKVSEYVYFATKSAAFSCPILHSLPFCPSVSYAAPLPLPVDPSLGLTAADLPENMTTPLLSGLANFTTMLTTLACGRDEYSPLVTCVDCQAAYRAWLCLVSLPRCGEYPPSSSSSSAASFASASPTAQQPFPALQGVDASSPTRNANVPPAPGNYTALLPCLETCQAVDRACPPFLKFLCPVRQFTAADSYGVGYIDSGWAGEMGGGSTGTPADIWGNVWCNA
ncbi:stretch-activated Ca2+-permeable channel component-domain-containing protein [Amylocystis lapponica]|nr:stretch-activated Ca2+-permeable channel component-domain-containing protein [Amylocystis lapponica]